MTNYYYGNKVPEKKWLVLSVGFRKEKTVLKSLSLNQIEAYVPLKVRSFKYPSKSVVRHLPIIPGYVFVKPAKMEIGRIIGQPFVFRFLKTGTNYSEVTEAEMRNLRRLSCTEHLEWFNQTEEDQLRQGDLVQIIRGPLTGIRGRFVSIKARNVFLISFGEHLQTQLGTFEVKPEDIGPLVELTTS